MDKKIQALIDGKEARKAQIVQLSAACDDVAQLRAYNAEMDVTSEEIRALSSLLTDTSDVSGRTAAVTSEVPGMVQAGAVVTRKADDDGIEYRRAFKEHILRGTPIPAELRANENTLTTDVTTVIPTVLVNRIIEKIESIGMILPLVTRTNYAAGVNIPTSSVKPVATWVAEGAGSNRRKKTTGVITFTHHKLRCEISMSMEVATMTLDIFETTFVRQVSEAMVKAIEEKIISADTGASNPRGILAETPPEGQALTVSGINYALLIEAEAAVPEAFEARTVWCMTKKTFMAFVGMTDSTGQPIARVNYGIGGKPERTLLGRSVVLCPYLPSWSDTLGEGGVFAFMFDFSDYILNTIYNMGIQKKQDWDTEDMLTKAVMSVDGKVVNTQSLITLTKGAAQTADDETVEP